MLASKGSLNQGLLMQGGEEVKGNINIEWHDPKGDYVAPLEKDSKSQNRLTVNLQSKTYEFCSE